MVEKKKRKFFGGGKSRLKKPDPTAVKNALAGKTKVVGDKESLPTTELAGPTPAPSPSTPAGLFIPTIETVMKVDIDNIDQSEDNLRITPNPKFSEIKEDIKKVGIKSIFNITYREGDARYETYGGGNTRLTILKELYAETGDEKFKLINVIFLPYAGPLSEIGGSYAENYYRAANSWYEKSMAVLKFVKVWMTLNPDEKRPSSRVLVPLLKEHRIEAGSHKTVARMMYTSLVLSPLLPKALKAGLVSEQCMAIQKNQGLFKNYLIELGVDEKEALQCFHDALASLDASSWCGIEKLQRTVAKYATKTFDVAHGRESDITLALSLEKAKLSDINSMPKLRTKMEDVKTDPDTTSKQDAGSVKGSSKVSKKTTATMALSDGQKKRLRKKQYQRAMDIALSYDIGESVISYPEANGFLVIALPPLKVLERMEQDATVKRSVSAAWWTLVGLVGIDLSSDDYHNALPQNCQLYDMVKNNNWQAINQSLMSFTHPAATLSIVMNESEMDIISAISDLLKGFRKIHPY